ncbi:MAG: hypothetical protein FD145_1343 [Candidatus Saganbacteria bacterium]|uniref:Flagellar motor switch protein FliM n=1 Tax=Candidatus Saganbacteria bacterium TaxID=2575572 RepID=A0A833L014_UNCSA|nr:MAG: hypothetical protein FD145_1343 [Candidatus Saganbacteria bacterium]
MADRSKPEMTPQKRSLKLAPALGDWTNYNPPKSLVKKVKVGLYGFDRLSDEEFKAAHLLHYKFGEYLLDNIKVGLKMNGELYLIEAFQGTYGNFLKSFNAPILQGRIEIIEFHDEINFAIDLSLVNSIINGCLGAKDTKNPSIELTEAEKIVLESPFYQFISNSAKLSLKQTIQDLDFECVGSPNFSPNPYINSSSTFVYFLVEVQIGEAQGKIIIGYSGSLIKYLLKKIKLSEKPKALPINKLQNEILNSTEIPIACLLGKTKLTGSELYSLEIGDVVSLDNSINSAIQIKLSDNGKFIFAQPGVVNGKFAARIVGIEKEAKVAPPIMAEVKSEEKPEEIPVEKEETEEFKEDEFTDEELADEELPEDEVGEETGEENLEEELTDEESEDLDEESEEDFTEDEEALEEETEEENEEPLEEESLDESPDEESEFKFPEEDLELPEEENKEDI